MKLEDQQAKARIVDLPRPGAAPLRLGVIDLPSFYAGNGDGNDRSAHGATADVARLLTKLQAEKVRGVALDLRRNGGGSLQEAIDLTSLFVGGGPVVQTRDAKGDIEVGADKHAKVRYTGPLVVLTSRFSASASEIVAGALQDYGRAVVVGDPSTFGKGTVQTIVPLGAVMDQAGLAHAFDPGALKVTISKFYRPSGASTELRGVASDIIIAAASGLLPVGEDKLDDPLPWDTIRRRALQSHLARSRRTWPRYATPRPVGWPPIPPSMICANSSPVSSPGWTASRSRSTRPSAGKNRPRTRCSQRRPRPKPRRWRPASPRTR